MSGHTLLILLLSSLATAVPVPDSFSPLHSTQNDPSLHPPLKAIGLDRRAIITPDYWAPSPKFTSMSEYNVTSFAAGATNLAIMRGSPSAIADGSTANMQEAFTTFTTNWNESVNSLQILYPKGSTAPRNDPQGGTEFYAHPLDLLTSRNVSLQYSVHFPSDFDFVKGGKLPGLYGGHKGCSGGNSAIDCFSTRMMWRADGAGELYLYVPKDKQTPALCSTPPKSVCSSEWGLSIGRGAWTFARGDWTTIRQDVWLNTPGMNDGGFNIWINGKLIMNANEVRYRENAASCNIDTIGVGQNEPFAAAAIASQATTSSIQTDAPSPTDMVVEAASATTSLSVSYDDGSYKWSASSDSASWSSSTEVPVWKREAGNMMRGDPFLLSTPSTVTVMSSDVQATPTTQSETSPSDVAAKTTTSTSMWSGADATGLAAPASQATQDCSIGFIGLFFSTFFGGHTSDWAPSSDQYTYFKDFQMWINA